MNHRYDVALIATHIEPAKGFGGVAESTARLAREWGRYPGKRIVVCASAASIDADLVPADVLPDSDVDVKLYRSYWFRRWGFGLGALPMLFSVCVRSRLVYISGIVTWPSTVAAVLCTLLRRPFVIAPRGGLMPGYVALVQRTKKANWCFYRLLTLPTMRHAQAIHCSGELETAGVRALLRGKVSLFAVPNGLDLERWQGSGNELASPERGLVLCYIGRISAEKGINAFIRAWSDVRRSADRMIVMGSGVAGAYLDEFETLLASTAASVDYRGYGDHDGVLAALGEAHFLVLPSGTWRESFGNTVIEALAAGRPVLVARGLEWDGLVDRGVGFTFGAEASEIAAAVGRAAGLDEASWREMCRAARLYAQQFDVRRTSERVWQMIHG